MINEQQARKFYKEFNPTQISIQKGKNLFYDIEITSEEEFIKTLSENEDKNLYSCYNRLKGRREAENIVEVNNVFIDVDDAFAYERLLNYLKEKQIYYSYLIKTGPVGHQLFIPIPKQKITENNKGDIEKIFANFINHLDLQGLADIKCKDIARLCRIWGTINNKEEYDKKVECKIIEEQEINSEYKKQNWENIKSISQEMKEEVYQVFDDSSSIECQFLDALIDRKIKLEKENTKFNDVIGKNICIYCYKRFGEQKARIISEGIYKLKNHNEREAEGWFKKIIKKQLTHPSCGEILKNIKEFYPELQKKYCKKCKRENQNNIIYLDSDENYKILKNEYESSSKFFISKEQFYDGILRPASEMQKVPIVLGKVFSAESDGEIFEVEDLDKKITLFFTDFDLIKKYMKDYKFLYDITANMYIYFFEEEGNKYTILSEKEIPLGRVEIEGMQVVISDKLKAFNYSTLSITQNVIFVHTFRTKTKKYSNFKELPLITSEELILELFNREHPQLPGNYFTFEQPNWYKNLLTYYFFSGKENNYPLHLILCGEHSCGKSELLGSVERKTEDKNIDLGSSTMKGLTPSFKGNIPRVGGLVEANRFAIIDEMLVNLHKEEEKEAAFAVLNNIIEHKRITATTGNGSLNVQMKAKIIAASNPVPAKTFSETIDLINKPFLSRFLVCHIPQDYLKWVADADIHKKENFNSKINSDEFLGIIDFMSNVYVKITQEDAKKIKDMVEYYYGTIPAYMQNYCALNGRFTSHHLVLILEGIVKRRCFDTRQITLEVEEDDFLELKEFFLKMIESWKDSSSVSVSDLSESQKNIIEFIGSEGLRFEDLKSWCKDRGIYDSEYRYLIDKSILRIEKNMVTVNEENFEEEMGWGDIF